VDEVVGMSKRLIRRGFVGLGAAILVCALPSAAGATDYCVGRDGCEPGNTYQTLEAALGSAEDASDADRVLIGPGTYTAAFVTGFQYQESTGPVEIVGTGIGQTILTGPAGVDSVLEVAGAPGTTVSDLTVHAPANAGNGFTGISTNNIARRVEVTADFTPGPNLWTGVYLGDGGTLEDSKVALGAAGHTGVFLDGGHVLRCSLSALIGVTANSGSIEHSRVDGFTGVKAYAGVTSIVASRILGGEEYGIYVASYAGVPQSTVNADSVTIVGGDAGKGAYASTDFDTGFSADLNLSNSVIRGFPVSLAASAPGTGKATVAASYSDYDPSGNTTSGSPNASIDESNVSNVGDAGFVDAASGDYHLLAGSPLVDAGDPTAAQGLDLDGNPLVADGNGDGSLHRDLGAYELPSMGSPPDGSPPPPPADTAAPVISGFRATPALFAIGRASTALAARVRRGTRFRYSVTEQARVTLKIQRRLRGRRARYRTVGKLSRTARQGANRTRFTGRLGRRALRPGRYRVRITATDAAGNRSTARATRFRIARG
jgi:hypothetical protein